MRCEILQELEPDDPKLALPWASPVHANLGYVDLKAVPQEIAELEECRKYPPLARLLEKINAAGSPLRSVKCDAWTSDELAEDERLDFDLPFKMGSYVDAVFDPPEHNFDLVHHLRFGEEVGRLLEGIRLEAACEIVVRRCLFQALGKWGCASTIFLHAYGATPAAARDEWARAVEALGEVLAEISVGMTDSPRA